MLVRPGVKRPGVRTGLIAVQALGMSKKIVRRKDWLSPANRALLRASGRV